MDPNFDAVAGSTLPNAMSVATATLNFLDALRNSITAAMVRSVPAAALPLSVPPSVQYRYSASAEGGSPAVPKIPTSVMP